MNPLSERQRFVLGLVSESPGITTDEVRSALGLWGEAGFSAASETLRRLAVRGLLTRKQRLEENVQTSRWKITAKGRKELG